MNPDTPLKISRYIRVKSWVKHHPKRAYAVISAIVILIGGITVFAMTRPAPEKVVHTPKIVEKKEEPKPVYYSPLSGEVVTDEAALTKPVTAIMIENSPDARPQSGLKDAEIVYEAVAEGGITRFLTLFQQHQPNLIGPVRSIRMYYVDWLTPYDASVAHIGGSYKALQLVRGGGYRDLDQFFNSQYYWRASDRNAPHNVYTSFAKLNQLNDAKGYKTSQPKVIERKDDGAAEVQDGRTINLTISGPLYNSSYAYDSTTKLYARSEAGVPHLDREGGQIQARVVVAMRVNMQQVFEDGYRESIATTGTGQAIIFQDGHANQTTWHKDDRTGQLYFTGADGQPFKLARGTTWISAIPNKGGNVTWQ